VPKQLALDEGLGQRGAVDGDKRLARPLAVVVDRPRHQLFARAALAGDEHRTRSPGGLVDERVDPLHGFAGPDHRVALPGLVQQAVALLLETGFFEGIAHRDERPLRVDRLLQKVVRADLRGLHSLLDGSLPAYNYDWNARVLGGGLLQDLHSGNARQL
jgi:hypothetical protein